MFSWLLGKNKSAKSAKDRLTIAIMSDRDNNSYPFMDEMKIEIMQVVQKYIGVKTVDIKKEVNGDLEALSIEIELEKKAD